MKNLPDFQLIPSFSPTTDNPFICNCELSWLSELISNEESIINLPKQTKCKLNLITAFESLDKDNTIPLITDLENFSKKLNYSFNSVAEHHRNYLNEMATKKKSSAAVKNQQQPNKDEIPLGEMNKCSSGRSINYRYHIYCFVLSFVMVHIIYYYLGFLFP